MSSFPEIDVELRLLLQEIAEDPKARLFKGEIPRPERITLGSVQPVSSNAARLTSAERKLVRVHREEVARVLRLAATSVLQEDPWMHRVGSGYHDQRTTLVVPERSDMIRMLQEVEVRDAEGTGSTLIRDSLSHATELLVNGCSDATRLAVMSLRLIQDDAAYVELARALLIHGQEGAAETMLWSIARRARQTFIGTVALSWIGVLYGRASRHQEASMINRAAAQWGRTIPTAHFSWLGCAILAKNRAAALDAVDEIDARYDPDTEALEEWTRTRRLERTQSMWTGSIESQRLAQNIAWTSGETSQRIADVFT